MVNPQSIAKKHIAKPVVRAIGATPFAENVFTLQSGVRFRSYLDDDLASVVAQWIGCQRVIYNAKVSEDHLFHAQRRMILRDNPFASSQELQTPLDRQYSHFKDSEQTPWLSDVPSQILRNGCDRWWEGKQRQLKGLSKMPTRRNKNNFNSVVISNELFRFVEWTDTHGVVQTSLELGTYADPVGLLRFHAHCAYDIPKQIIIRRTGNHWWLSFSYEHAAPEEFVPRDAAELAFELDLLDDDALKASTIGIDRNVKDNCIATSDGRFYRLREIEQIRLDRKAKGAVRIQRRFARCKKGSNNSAKMRRRINAKHEYRGNVARDFSHQTSHDLVTGAIDKKSNTANVAPKLIVFENLKIKNMTAAPKAKQDPVTGKWLRNGAAAKAGLNKAILGSCWGSIDTQVHYKAYRLNTLVLKISAAYSSQECSRCGHIHPDNRHEQRFACQHCGFSAHADTNASCVIAGRGIRQVRDHKVVVKQRKCVAFRKKGVRVNGNGRNRNKERNQEHEEETPEGIQTGRESSGVPAEGHVSQNPSSGRSFAVPDETGKFGLETRCPD